MIVRNIFEYYTNGYSTTEMSRLLSKENFKTNSGSEFAASVLLEHFKTEYIWEKLTTIPNHMEKKLKLKILMKRLLNLALFYKHSVY